MEFPGTAGVSGRAPAGKQHRLRVYASYYVMKLLKNKGIMIFELTLYDKYSIFCHIWKPKVSHLQ